MVNSAVGYEGNPVDLWYLRVLTLAVNHITFILELEQEGEERKQGEVLGTIGKIVP